MYHKMLVAFGLEAYGQEEDSLQDEENRRRDIAAKRIISAWQRMHQEGAAFYVDGEAVQMTDAVTKVVREDGVYMADYVWGETGKIKEVRLDKVDVQ